MAARSEQIQHAGTAAFVHLFAARVEFMRRDPARPAPHAATLVILARNLEMEQWSAHANMLEGWADWRAGYRSLGLAGLRQAIAFLRAKNYAAFDPLNDTILAEAETEAGEFDAALATSDHAFAESARTGQRWLDAELHRARGEILLKQNPADRAPAEQSSSPRSPSRNSRRPGVSNCAPRSPSPSSMARPAASPTPTPCSDRARRLLADAGVSGDRGGAGAVRGARANR
jgi:predicted ATPase